MTAGASGIMDASGAILGGRRPTPRLPFKASYLLAVRDTVLPVIYFSKWPCFRSAARAAGIQGVASSWTSSIFPHGHFPVRACQTLRPRRRVGGRRPHLAGGSDRGGHRPERRRQDD